MYPKGIPAAGEQASDHVSADDIPGQADCSNLQAQIDRWIANVIDLDVVVDDRRRELDAATRARDEAADHLRRLIEWVAEFQISSRR